MSAVMATAGSCGIRDGLVWLDSAPYSSSISLSGACSGTWDALAGSGGMYLLSRSVAVR